MSLPRTSDEDMETKYGWVVKLIRDFSLPIVILGAITYFLAVRVEQRFNALENSIITHQRFLQQICVNTSSGDWQKEKRCWGIE